MKNLIDIDNRKTAFVELDHFDVLSNKDSHNFMEVTEWSNGEGWDIVISAHKEQMFSLTWGEFKALKKLIKALEK